MNKQEYRELEKGMLVSYQGYICTISKILIDEDAKVQLELWAPYQGDYVIMSLDSYLENMLG